MNWTEAHMMGDLEAMEERQMSEPDWESKRIEELKAKLEACKKYRDAYAECDRISTHALRKAVEALEYYRDQSNGYRAMLVLAELKGETDE